MKIQFYFSILKYILMIFFFLSIAKSNVSKTRRVAKIGAKAGLV